MSEQLDAALAHASRGWKVFPLRIGDKRPAVRDWETRATTDAVRIHRAWGSQRGARCNVGIACGPSNLVVVDLDTPAHGSPRPYEWDKPGIDTGADVFAALAEQHGEPPPFETFSVETVSGGEHVYFAAPDGPAIRNSAGKVGWLIDVRGAGGYVVAAGSKVGGRRYRSNGHAEVARLPRWLTAAIQQQPRPSTDLGRFLDVCQRPVLGPRWWPGESPRSGGVQAVLMAAPFFAVRASRMR
ncbi:bifunctional DNA primase/polymerase [Pseudonocardia sp. WMMC193]|uniref:bifunctional DNA primase/polymerase n=1 Tax=Pseudonocardia sp. WMMC193 TaxID=2911965 RepID=UPI0035AC12FB